MPDIKQAAAKSTPAKAAPPDSYKAKSLFDMQVNGFAGIDFQQGNLSLEALQVAVAQLAVHQTRRFFVALITDSVEALGRKLKRLETLRSRDEAVHRAVCGYHVEGPWLSPKPGYCGAHDPSLMSAPDAGAFHHLQACAQGNIKLFTLAPELPGAVSCIEAIVKSGAEVALGHTEADGQSIDAAIAAGARFCTHLGNAVPEELPRHDNVIQRLLSRDELYAFFIPDGLHVPPSVLKNYVRAKPPGKTLFTTDCMAGAGAPPGSYTLGGLNIDVGEDRVARFPGGLHFAGSTLTPDEGVDNLRRWLGYTVQEARAPFSQAAAEPFGIDLPDL